MNNRLDPLKCFNNSVVAKEVINNQLFPDKNLYQDLVGYFVNHSKNLARLLL